MPSFFLYPANNLPPSRPKTLPIPLKNSISSLEISIPSLEMNFSGGLPNFSRPLHDFFPPPSEKKSPLLLPALTDKIRTFAALY